VAVCLLVLVSGAPFNAVEKPWFYNGDVNRKPYFSLEVSKSFEKKKTHTAPTAPLVIHCTRTGKNAMKKFGIYGKWRNKLVY
jgi:hypothetical protein